MPAVQQPSAIASPALRCAGLVKRFADVTAVAGVDLEVRRGECFGLLGPNGAGKTTTVEILEGLTAPTAGQVEVLGVGWSGSPRRDRALRARLGVQLQETQLPPKLTVEEVATLFASFYPGGRSAAELVEVVGLEEKRRSRVDKLSGGQKQRLSLACALAGEPEVLFLDEPTTGLDPQARLRIWEIVESFRAGGGTVLLTTHYMEEAARLCDRLAVLDHGRVIALGTPAELVASLGAHQIVELDLAHEAGGEGAIPAPPAVDGARLAALPGVHEASRRDATWVLAVSDIGAAMPALLAELERGGTPLVKLTTHQPTLEDVFVHLTGRALRDA
jgi:ABC-2 type transport system ATP-binding protein